MNTVIRLNIQCMESYIYTFLYFTLGLLSASVNIFADYHVLQIWRL